jgi:UTP-glucose-1-phosphate uridylyltransferase
MNIKRKLIERIRITGNRKKGVDYCKRHGYKITFLGLTQVRIKGVWHSAITAERTVSDEPVSLVDGVYDLVFRYKPESQAQAKWREDWLEKARKHGVGLE